MTDSRDYEINLAVSWVKNRLNSAAEPLAVENRNEVLIAHGLFNTLKDQFRGRVVTSPDLMDARPDRHFVLGFEQPRDRELFGQKLDAMRAVLAG